MSVKSTLRLEKFDESHLSALLLIEPTVNTAPWSERAFRNELNHDNGIFRVAIQDGEVVGYGGVWLVIDEAHITTVAVKPEVQRQGIGRRLVIELLSAARDQGMLCSTLEVRAGNDVAIRLYERLGFQQAAVRRKYYPDNQEDAVVMWLYDLKSWEPPFR